MGILRGHRVRALSTSRWLSGSSEVFLRNVLEQRLLGMEVPAMSLPEDFELAKQDGWCLLSRGGGMLAVVACPLNMTDDKTGQVVGEVAALEARHPPARAVNYSMRAPRTDLWALVVFRRDAEPLEDFALRVRMAMVTRQPGGMVAAQPGGE